MSLQMPLIPARPPSLGRSTAVQPASKAFALLALVTIGVLHVAILVTAFAVTPLLPIAFVGVFSALLAGLVAWRAPSDGMHSVSGSHSGEGRLEFGAAGDFIATTARGGASECPTVTDRARRPAMLHRILSVDDYVLLVAQPGEDTFEDGATTMRVKLADYRAPAPGSVAHFQAQEAVEGLLNSGALTVELQGRDRDGNRMSSIWAGVTPIAPALMVMGHSGVARRPTVGRQLVRTGQRW